MRLRLIILFTIISIGYSEPYRGGELRTDQSFQYGRFETKVYRKFSGSVEIHFFYLRLRRVNGTEH